MVEGEMFNWVVEFVSSNWRYAIALFFFYGSLKVGIDWTKDLKFYSKNSWDFSKQSGIKLNQAIGDSTPVPNKARVLVVAPMLVCIFAASGFVIAFT